MIEIYRNVGVVLLMMLGLGCIFAAVRGFDHLKSVLNGVRSFPSRIQRARAYQPRHAR